jgi:hypothetical protein
MDLKSLAVAVLLFFVLSPSVLVRLPPKGDKYVVAGTHTLVFGILFYFINSLVVFEGFVEGGPESMYESACNTSSDETTCNNKYFYDSNNKKTHKCKLEYAGQNKPPKCSVQAIFPFETSPGPTCNAWSGNDNDRQGKKVNCEGKKFYDGNTNTQIGRCNYVGVQGGNGKPIVPAKCTLQDLRYQAPPPWL